MDADQLRPEHLAELVTAHAIAPEVAVHVATSVQDGMIFKWWDGNGTLVGQFRRDPDRRVDGRPKYEWPQGQPTVLNRWREPEPGASVLLVEGTCQHLAVASWTNRVGVYGMVGCWGWSKTDLTWAAGRDVVVAFDADLSSNRRVWDAAKALGDALRAEGATGVRFIKPPGRVKEGLDDVLARRAPDTRTEFLDRLIAAATDKLGRAPAAKVEVKIDVVAAEIMRAQPVALTAENRVALYRDGAYRRDPAAFNAVAVEVLGENYWPALADAIEKFVAGKLYRDGVRLPDRIDRPLLNVANGMLDLTTGELMAHDPVYLSSAQLPVTWDPGATCPHYEAWLTAQAGDQADDLEEVTSTMLDPSRTPAKAGFLFGASRSGKSTWIRLAEAVAGSVNTSAVTLAQLAENRFAAANVYGKILNAAAEVRAGHIEDLDIFKKMTGNDPIEGERKHVQMFKFYNRALFIFAANELPTVGESSRAYSERIKPFRFSRSFAGAEDQSIEDAIMAELPGVLVRWVRAWQRLRARGTYLLTHPKIRREFEARSDRVRMWLYLCCRVVDRDEQGSPVRPNAELPGNAVTTKRELARQFGNWSAYTGGSAMAERKIIDRLTSIDGVYEVRTDRASGRVRGLNVIVLPQDQWSDDLTGIDTGAELEILTVIEDQKPLTRDGANGSSSISVLTCGGADGADSGLLQPIVGLSNGEVESDNRLQWAETAPLAPSALPAETSKNLPAYVLRGGVPTPCTLDDAREGLIKAFRATGALTVDVETSGFPVGHRAFELRTVQLGTAERAWVFDVRRHSTPDQWESTRRLIADLLAVVPRLHAHSATADLVPLAYAGLCDESTWARMYDTVIPAKLADPKSTGADPGLKQLAGTLLGAQAVSPAADAARAALFKAHKWRTKIDASTPVDRSGWAQVDPGDPVMITYAASDVLDTAALATRLPELPPAVHQRERAVQRVTARVAHRGLRIDGEHVIALRERHGAARTAVAELVRAFDIDNPGSDRQVAARLAELGVHLPRTKPSQKYPAGQPSVAAGVLERLRGSPGQAGALVAAVLEFRHHDTVIGTFLEPYHQMVIHGDGRARPTIYTLGTDTGRMSCVRPNLQQLPREGGVRACITADPGDLLVSADFAGVELRVAAALSGDDNLRRMLAQGVDLHWLIAREVWGADATKADRYTAKRIVFGRFYGGGVPTLAAQAGVSESVAASAVGVLDSLTPGLALWSRQLRDLTRAGAVAMPTYAGRVIHLTRDYPHKAPNYAIQGTARELLVDAIERWERTRWAGSVVLPVHDEVITMVPEAEAEEATAALVECMTSELHGVEIKAEASKPSFAWADAV